MMTFALLAPYQILEVCLWQGKSESDIHGTYFFQKTVPRTLEILAPTVTYFKKNTFGAIKGGRRRKFWGFGMLESNFSFRKQRF